ncbi:MAG: T9SS type A sorting domain-containing protein [Flavobacteriales bacterium]|nr:T9SS type A sorting domain-containing protein [Flavobacteriales bacterium]MCB9363628.1 T9SS type A sorting domain-containing protein [Flavobacteriales bacterium]
MYNILKVLIALFFLNLSQFLAAATCSETVTTNGQDDGPTVTTINSFPCTGGGTITAMTLDASIGGSCTSWYDYDIYINGILQFSNQCNQTGLDISAFLPITSVELRSRDNDAFSDNINLSLTLNITYTAGPMAYSSCTTTQNNTTNVVPGATDQEIIGIEVVTTGETSPFDLTQLRLRTTGTTDWTTDLTGNLKVYYTGNSSTFATTTLFGTATLAAPGTNIFVNGTQTLASGTNYFWVAYDIASGATLNNFVDALCNRITIGGGVGNQIPTVTTPAGNREIDIVYCTSNATSSGDSEVDNVVLVGDINTISNNTASTCATYSDFTGLTPAELTPASNYQVDVTIGTCGGNYTKYARVFIDWNKDGDFADANEDLGEQGGVSATSTYNFNFTVPAGATIGNTRMRVICKEGSGISSCGTYSYGETEDYTVTIVTPGPMSYTSCTTTQTNISSVSACSGNQEIIGVQVVMSGVLTPLDLTQFQINMTGTTNIADVSNIDIFYTSTSSTFAATNLFASASPAGGTITLNGTQTLSSGTNYFWIAYDMAAGATATNVLDARCTQITVDGINRTPTVTNPAGNRAITSCIVSPGGVSNNITAWFDAKNGAQLGGSPATNGGRVDLWTNNAGNVSVPTVTQGTNANRPFFRTNEINWNPILEFDGADDYLSQASTLGSDLFSNTDNTVIMMHRMNSGIVYFKWEQGPTGADRIGFEYSGGKVRFDFPDDAGGNQTVSNANYSAVGEIVTGKASANVSTLRINGALDVTNSTSGTMNTNTNQQFVIGANDLGNPLYCSLDFAELAVYKTGLSDADMNRIESYLAIKYGITLGTNGTSMDYNSVYGNTVWDISANNGYCYDIAGIAREDNSALDQRKSRTINETAGNPRDMLTVANGTNFTTPTAFSSDQGYFVWGHNDLATQSNLGTDVASPILTRFARVWKGQETGTVGTVTLEFDMSAVPGVTTPGTNDLNDVRLLVDADGVFATGATVISPSYVDNTSDIVRFQHNFASGTGFYFTIGTVDLSTAPLPVTLTNFTANCVGSNVELNWSTQTEVNNDYFTIEKSENGFDFYALAQVNGNGNSQTSINYNFIDDSYNYQAAYYRLKQTDYNGNYEYHNIVAINCNEFDDVNIYPNPTNGLVNLNFGKTYNRVYITVKNVLGQIVSQNDYTSTNLVNLDIKGENGIYFIELATESGFSKTIKVIKR